ncbi:N-6 DNA methylase [Bifidobacterium stellenboschense]|nr:N-6 DNA methylase [Bifidobacterium stellenboschense]
MSIDRADFKRLVNRMSGMFRDSLGGGILERFEDVSKLLFIRMYAEEHGLEGQLTAKRNESRRTVYERARALWEQVLSTEKGQALRGTRGTFPEDVAAVVRCLSLFDDVRLTNVDADVKGAAYEELLRDTFEKNENQQYFTPRHLMEFVVEMASPAQDDVVLDPACGSGGFLIGALNHADCDVLGLDVDDRMTWVARINVLLHNGDPYHIECLKGAGSLSDIDVVNHALRDRKPTMILTNPPFGSDLADEDVLDTFQTGKGRKTRRRGILFIERCIDLLDEGGVLAVVIDDSVLNLPANHDIRELMEDRCVIDAVVSLPDVTFMPYSTAKSSVVLLHRKHEGEVQGRVFMADAENVGNRPNGDPLYEEFDDAEGRRVLKTDLPTILEAWRRFKQEGAVPRSYLPLAFDTVLNSSMGLRLDVNSHHPSSKLAQTMLQRSQEPVRRLCDLVEFAARDIDMSAEEDADAVIPWIGLGDIEANTGDYEVSRIPRKRIKSAPHTFKGGDVLISRLRPKLRKVIRIPEDADSGYCSAELIVLRQLPEAEALVDMDYLSVMLRSDVVFGQMVPHITGIGRPRVGVPMLKNVRIPVPALSRQREIVARFREEERKRQDLKAEIARMRIREEQMRIHAYEDSLSAAFAA